MNTVEELSNDVKVPTLHVEIFDVDGNSSVDSFNNQSVTVEDEHGGYITLGFSIPSDESAAAFVYSLMLGANIDTIKTHRTNSDGVSVLTLKHEVQLVSDWSIESNLIKVKFMTESSVIINGDLSVEEDSSDSSN